MSYETIESLWNDLDRAVFCWARVFNPEFNCVEALELHDQLAEALGVERDVNWCEEADWVRKYGEFTERDKALGLVKPVSLLPPLMNPPAVPSHVEGWIKYWLAKMESGCLVIDIKDYLENASEYFDNNLIKIEGPYRGLDRNSYVFPHHPHHKDYRKYCSEVIERIDQIIAPENSGKWTYDLTTLCSSITPMMERFYEADGDNPRIITPYREFFKLTPDPF